MRDRFDDFRFVGGEPLMDADRLEAALAAVSGWAKRRSITTNGFFVGRLRGRLSQWKLDSVRLSVDGDEAAHNLQRGHPQAYQRAREAATVLRDLGVPFQVAYCVTRTNRDDLRAVYQFCEEFVAEFLRIQPLVPLSDQARRNPSFRPRNWSSSYATPSQSRVRWKCGSRNRLPASRRVALRRRRAMDLRL